VAGLSGAHTAAESALQALALLQVSLYNCNTQQHTLQHAATHCNALQRTATHCNIHWTTHCNTHCNASAFPGMQRTPQHAATFCNALQHTHSFKYASVFTAHNATHCNTLQHNAAHYTSDPTACLHVTAHVAIRAHVLCLLACVHRPSRALCREKVFSFIVLVLAGVQRLSLYTCNLVPAHQLVSRVAALLEHPSPFVRRRAVSTYVVLFFGYTYYTYLYIRTYICMYIYIYTHVFIHTHVCSYKYFVLFFGNTYYCILFGTCIPFLVFPR